MYEVKNHYQLLPKTPKPQHQLIINQVIFDGKDFLGQGKSKGFEGRN